MNPRALYFDGRSSMPHEVMLAAGPLGLQIHGMAAHDAVHRWLTHAQLSFDPPLNGSPGLIRIDDGAHCELADASAYAALSQALGVKPSSLARIEKKLGLVSTLLAALVMLLVLIYQWGLPMATDLLVKRLPVHWDTRLGEITERQMVQAGLLAHSALSPSRQQAILVRFAALRKAPGAPRHVIRFYRFNPGHPNALALPGGTIILSDQLVDLADNDDALCTVLGHELAHLHHRDPMRGLIRASLVSALAAWLLGDVSSVAAVLGTGIATVTYTRQMESAADRYALDLMRDNGINTHGAATLFRRLEYIEKKLGAAALPDILRSHPATADRIRLFESAPQHAEPLPP